MAPQATAATQDSSRVTVAVAAQVARVPDCSTAGAAVPISPSLSAPLGERTLADAATEQQVGGVTYSLRVTPSEGNSMTLDEFRRERARLTWT